ncbi:MAG: preprotein translocase subunit SecE [Planctomycetaceae bacterium]|nr:preprotein translocase subunit SecE [Planctomycetaceae bacterium]
MPGFFQELLRAKRYKPSQGKIARSLTGIGIAIVFFCGAYTFYFHTSGWDPAVRSTITFVVAAIGAWLAFRTIHWAPFADFLVSVESEMMKVSWPAKPEIYSSTIVVLTVLGLLALVVFLFDIVWYWLFHFFFQII